MRRRDLLLASLAAPVAARPTGAQTSGRSALVIGNGSYPSAPLPTARNDALRIAAKLRQLRFVVAEGRNMERKPMQMGVTAGIDAMKPGDLVLVYYSGHALQVSGRNYLVPVNFEAERLTDQSASRDMISVDRLIERIEPQQRRAVIVLLDACWPNPLARTLRLPGTGLAAMRPPEGTLIIFAAEPGAAGFYGDQPTSPLATALLEALDMRGLPIERLVEQVRTRVDELTKGEQRIWVGGALKEAVVLAQPDG